MRTLFLKNGYYLKFNKGIYPINFAIKHDLIFLDEVADLLEIMRAKKVKKIEVDDILDNEPHYRREPHLRSSDAILNGRGNFEPRIDLISEEEGREALDFFERDGGAILSFIEKLYNDYKEKCLMAGDFSCFNGEKTKQQTLIAEREAIDKLLQGLSFRSDVSIDEYRTAIKMILQLERKVFFYACGLGEKVQTLLQIHNSIKKHIEFLATLSERREFEIFTQCHMKMPTRTLTLVITEKSTSYEEEKSRQENYNMETAIEKPCLRHPLPEKRIDLALLALNEAATPTISHVASHSPIDLGFLPLSQSKGAKATEDPFKKCTVPSLQEVQEKAKNASMLSEILRKKN